MRPELMTPLQAAVALEVSLATVYRWLDEDPPRLQRYEVVEGGPVFITAKSVRECVGKNKPGPKGKTA